MDLLFGAISLERPELVAEFYEASDAWRTAGPALRSGGPGCEDVKVDDHRTTPSTFVQVGKPDWWAGYSDVPDRSLDPRTAAVLSAVLMAAAEQVSAAKLAAFGVKRAVDLSLLGLAMAFRDDDTGLVGDVFEWSVLLGANGADAQIVEVLSDALVLLGLHVERPQAVLVAAERGRLVQYSPDVPPGAALATGRRGRPPQVANLLATMDTRTWKADLLVGAEDRWVAASLKSNPMHMARSLQQAASTPHPPRIGVTATSPANAGVIRDPGSRAVIVKLPVDSRYLALSKAVLSDVRDAFARHLSPPGSPLLGDTSGIGRQLHRWQDRTVGDVLEILLEVAGDAALEVGQVRSTGVSADEAKGSLVALNPLREPRPTDLLSGHSRPRRMLEFDPID